MAAIDDAAPPLAGRPLGRLTGPPIPVPSPTVRQTRKEPAGVERRCPVSPMEKSEDLPFDEYRSTRTHGTCASRTGHLLATFFSHRVFHGLWWTIHALFTYLWTISVDIRRGVGALIPACRASACLVPRCARASRCRRATPRHRPGRPDGPCVGSPCRRHCATGSAR